MEHNSTPTLKTTSSNSNLPAMASSTPIRIGSFHGTHSSENRPASVAVDTFNTIAANGQQSSSVPTAATLAAHMPANAAATTPSATGASNQSLIGGGGTANAGLGSSLTPPNSAGLRPGGGGGLANWASDNRDKNDGNQSEKTSNTDALKLNRKESYKAQRKNYRREKKRVATELLNSLQDPAVIVLADWLKVRGTLKSWTKLWCVLKPGHLLIYKSPKTKSSHWVGTILLTSCQVIERPSKKDGFCFKLFHPLEQSIWAPRGPDKETIGAVTQPLPTTHLIFRAPSQAAGKCWMDALELSLRCSALLLRNNSSLGAVQSTCVADAAQISHETQWSEADYEKHFNEHDLDADSQNEGAAAMMSGPETDSDSDVGEPAADIEDNEEPAETPYVPVTEEVFGESGEQIEVLAEENKSLIWCLVKQVRPGMDLSKVVLPTFILEPRSFLDKLSDSYFHADILSKAVAQDDPFTRMKTVVQWYLSGFYKKPKGLKKPYNPILGETFRCYWEHPNGSRTFYIAEQVSHHPPVSAFYVTNRQDGFCINCSILAKSKFYGNSTSAVLEGVATLTLLPRGESYTLNTPYAHCKGILVGTLSMELGGKINIDCENTGYKTELEFKLKPLLGGSDIINGVSGKIKLGKETLAYINGHWDTEMRIKDAKTGEESVLFSINSETKQKRLTRFVVPIEAQLPNESERLWQSVSQAIRGEDQVAATQEKTVLEEAQRNSAKERQSLSLDWDPQHFQLDPLSGEWLYKYADLRPWDMRNDLRQYEAEYKVLTKTKHKAPMVRTSSIVSSDALRKVKNQASKIARLQRPLGGSILSDSSQSAPDEYPKRGSAGASSQKSIQKLAVGIEKITKTLEDQSRQLMAIQSKLDRIQYAPSGGGKVQPCYQSFSMESSRTSLMSDMFSRSLPQSVVVKTVLYSFAGILLMVFLKWLFK